MEHSTLHNQIWNRLTQNIPTTLCYQVKIQVSCRVFFDGVNNNVCLRFVLHLRSVKSCRRTALALSRTLFLQGNNWMKCIDCYLGSCTPPGGHITEETSSRTQKARLAFANLRHLWRRHDIRLAIKSRVHTAVVRSVLLLGSETWPLRTENMRKTSVLEDCCLLHIGRRILQRRVYA